MANRNGTGPEGKGSMTGRGMGNCVKTESSSKENSEQTIQRGQGRGCGLGRGNDARGNGQGRGNGRGRGCNQ